MNIPPSFYGERFDIWKERIKIFFYSIDFDLWNFILNGPFVLIYFINNELVDKPNYLKPQKKGKVQLHFQAKFLMTNPLRTRELFLAFNCKKSKEVWDSLREIHEVPNEIKKVNTCIKEN